MVWAGACCYAQVGSDEGADADVLVLEEVAVVLVRNQRILSTYTSSMGEFSLAHTDVDSAFLGDHHDQDHELNEVLDLHLLRSGHLGLVEKVLILC